MDGLKYSLKTNQFSKRKRQIFDKKQSTSSLVIHEPSSDLDLHELNYTQVTENKSKQYNFHNVQENSNINFEYFEPQNLLQSSSNKSSLELTVSEQKKKLNLSDLNSKQQCSSQAMSELIWTRQLLLRNEERINCLNDSINKIAQSTANLYENHAQHLKEVVSKRCMELTSLLIKTVKVIENKCKKANDLDNRISIFCNTLKDSRQTLRLLSIKQECLELQLGRKKSTITNQIKKQKQLIAPLSMENNHYMKKEVKRRNVEKQLFLDFDDEKKTKDIFDSSPISEWRSREESFYCLDEPIKMKETFFFKESPEIKSPLLFEDSPFNESSFETEFSKEYTFNSHRNPESNDYEEMVQLLKSTNKEKQQVWMDNLNCLRTKYGGYLLDQAGNAIICSRSNFARLMAEGIIQAKK